MALSYDDLFALRLALQDNITDETYIIKELKRSLVSSGMNFEQIDNYLLDFYKSFGIDYMTIDIIRENSIENSHIQDSDDDIEPDSDDDPLELNSINMSFNPININPININPINITPIHLPPQFNSMQSIFNISINV